LKKIRQLYRDADAILNVCGTQEFNDDLLVSDRILHRERPRRGAIKIDKGVKSTVEYLRRHHALFTFGETRNKRFSGSAARIQWLPTRQPVVTDLWKTARSPSRTACSQHRELVHKRFERHHVARQNIPVEQIA